MGNRCPNCNKFSPLDECEAETQQLEVSLDGTVTAEVRIYRNCADCGGEMKEATLYMEMEGGMPCECKEPDLEVKEGNLNVTEEEGGKYKKAYFGAVLTATVRCNVCGKEKGVELSDKVAASEMDDLNY